MKKGTAENGGVVSPPVCRICDHGVSRWHRLEDGEAELCDRLKRVVKCLIRENKRIECMGKGSIEIHFAGESLSIRMEEFVLEE